MIASCLVKDPSKRPSAQKLLKHSFFKQARSNDYIARTLLEGLPALGDRLQALKVNVIPFEDVIWHAVENIWHLNVHFVNECAIVIYREKNKTCLQKSKYQMDRRRKCHRFEVLDASIS